MDDDKLLAYFERIGYSGTPSVSLQTLADIQKLHVTAIPFENIGIFTGVPKSVDFNTIYERIVKDKKGGWCFEQNTLLYQVLLYLGFTVTRYLARVRLMVPADVETALTHFVLKVKVPEGDYLVDVAFGAGSPTEPLKMQDQFIQKTDMDLRRLSFYPDGSFMHELAFFNNPEAFIPFYHVWTHQVQDVDLLMGSWYCETFPKSRFVNNLIAAVTFPTHRISLENRNFAKRYADGTNEKKVLGSVEEVQAVLKEEFGLDYTLPSDSRLLKVLGLSA